MKQYTYIGDYTLLESLTQHGDCLVELDRHIQWAPLVAVAENVWRAGADKKAACGQKLWSAEVMLRVLVLKRLYNRSDEQMEYQLRDRLSFLRFVRHGLGDAVPDSRTIWLYAEQLAKVDGVRELFAAFNRQLAERCLLVKEGVMVDATFVEVPRQRNTREDNARIKQGETPAEWLQPPRKLAQKDVAAASKAWARNTSVAASPATAHRPAKRFGSPTQSTRRTSGSRAYPCATISTRLPPARRPWAGTLTARSGHRCACSMPALPPVARSNSATSNPATSACPPPRF